MRVLAAVLTLLLFVVSTNSSYSQKPKEDKGQFIEVKSEFWDKIEKSAKDFKKSEEPKKPTFKMDFTGYDLPKSVDEFKKVWFNEPISQGWSGMCWCFSATSFFETEVYRLYKKELKISELFTVYWEYVEKARRFIRERGKSAFGEGSQSNGVSRIWKQYGCVPASSYTGLKPNQEFHDHTDMFREMNNYLQSVKANSAWNEEQAIETIKSIMNGYIGEPPTKVVVDGKEMTPKEYLQNVVRINPDDYVEVLSLMEKPYYQKVEYEVTDNWWKSSDFYNVPLDEFMSYLKNSIKKGYSVVIGGDVSESGYDSHDEVAMIPSYDIPSNYINEYSRQFRFSNGTTTDDHGIHIVGYKEKDGVTWYLIKDSGSGSRNGTNKGYYFYHEDYIKLKMMNFMIHRSAIEDLLKKFK